MRRTLLTLALVSGAVIAGPTVPEGGRVWDLPESSGRSVTLDDIPPPPPVVPIRGESIAAAAWSCYPEPDGGWFRPEVRAVFGPRMTPGGDALIGYWAGVTATLPLYSHAEIERERERAHERRLAIARAVGELLEARAIVLRGEREIALWDAIETRARARVAAGVAPSSEQEAAAARAIEARARVDAARAKLESARLILLAPCDDAGRQRVEAALREGMPP